MNIFVASRDFSMIRNSENLLAADERCDSAARRVNNFDVSPDPQTAADLRFRGNAQGNAFAVFGFDD